MNSTILKRQRLQQRQLRVRSKITGTADRPRLAVSRSVKHVICQLIDDVARKTLVSTSDTVLKATGTKTERAKTVGVELAKLAKTKGITTIVFDRSGRAFHGRVKAVADGAREGGLKF